MAKTERLTAAELVGLRPHLAELELLAEVAEANYEEARRRRDGAVARYREVRAVDEVFEGVPLAVTGSGHPRIEPLGADLEFTRQAKLSPIMGDEDDFETDAGGNSFWSGPHVLFLSGSGWEKPYMVVKTREEGLRLAKKFAAHGVVPGPPEEGASSLT